MIPSGRRSRHSTFNRFRDYTLLLITVLVAYPARSQTEPDSAAVLNTLDSWNRGWAEKNADLAVQDYAEDADWTNAFGDRFQGREALRKGLKYIFSLAFVMAGDSGGSEFADVTVLQPDVVLIRSKLVRVGQQTSDGKRMPDRHINHLRVLHHRDGEWQIVSHLISQAHEKR